jgi:3'(2'), 5'-bisphosphate nucleotidase
MFAPRGDDAALLDAIVDIALRAGDEIRAIERAAELDVRSKADASLLTRADLRAHQLIAAALASLDPDTFVVSEEGTHYDGGVTARRFWLVDPLDGTREFVAGNGEYTVNIALVEDGVPTLGVVHAPARGVTYAATRGGGATRTDAHGTIAIRAKRAAEPVVVTSRSHRGTPLETFLRALPAHRTLAMGSALKMCLVADGTAQLYPRIGPTCWWDTAAPQTIAVEAGATVTRLDGTPLHYRGRSMLNESFVCSSLPRDAWRAAADAIAKLG